MKAREGRQLDRRAFLKATAAGLGMGTVLAACAPAGSQPSAEARPAAQAGSARKVTLVLDVSPYGKHAMFYVPLERGYWREAGLEVAIESAKGSGDTVSKVGAKAGEFGFADIGAIIIGRANGALTKCVAMIHYKNLMGVMSLRKYNVTKPQDLEGKAVAVVAGDAGRVMLPPWAKVNHFDPDKLNLITVEQTAKPSMLIGGQAQATLDFLTTLPAYVSAARQAGEEATSFLYADYGLDIYNNGLLVHDDLLVSDPDLVRRFVEPLTRGVVWSVEHPDEATDILLKYAPALNKDTARAQLQIAIDHLMVDEVRRNGVGPMSPEKVQFTLDMIQQNYQLPRQVTLDEIYSNDFVPKGIIPQV